MPITHPYAIGSGRSHAKALEDAREYSQGDDYIGSVLSSAANVLSFELSYGLNLHDLWGGMILPVTLQGGSYQIFSNHMLLFFAVEEYPNGSFKATLHPYIFRPLFLGMTCLLQRINWHAQKLDYFCIPTVLDLNPEIKKSDIPRSDYHPQYYCFSGMFRHADNQNTPFALTMPHTDAGEYFKLEFSAGVVAFSYSMKLISTLVEIAKLIQRNS